MLLIIIVSLEVDFFLPVSGQVKATHLSLSLVRFAALLEIPQPLLLQQSKGHFHTCFFFFHWHHQSASGEGVQRHHRIRIEVLTPLTLKSLLYHTSKK